MTLTLMDQAGALSAINADQDLAVARDVTGLFNAHGHRNDLSHAMHTTLPDVIDLHAHNSGLLTTHWYDGIDPSSSFRAKPFTDIPAEQVTKVIDWALHAPGDEPPLDRLVGASQRLVRGASRQTVTGNAAREGVLWARYAQPEACSFCRALSIRGQGKGDRKYLYSSDKTAEFRKSDGEAYHTHCKCEAVAVRAGQVWTPPDYTADWSNQYNEAAKKTDGGAKYFQRVVQRMRVNEEAAVAKKAADEAEAAARANEGNGANVIDFPQPDPEHVAARETLDAATTFEDIEAAAETLLPDTVVMISNEAAMQAADAGSPNLWDRKRDRVLENAKELVRAVDDVMVKYPDLDLFMVRDVDKSHFASGVAGGYTDPYATAATAKGGGGVVNFSRSWLVNVATLDSAWEEGVQTGFHYEGTDNPVYNIVTHEMGHIMQRTAEDAGVDITDDDIRRALAAEFVSGRESKVFGGATMAAYDEWLADNLSGYSTHQTVARGGQRHAADVSGLAPINGREALAEAFADVEVNGEQEAHETSIVLHALLISAYNESVKGGSSHGLAPAV